MPVSRRRTIPGNCEGTETAPCPLWTCFAGGEVGRRCDAGARTRDQVVLREGPGRRSGAGGGPGLRRALRAALIP